MTYKDLRSLVPYEDKRKPAREIELHLTGVMEHYMWSFDGNKFSEAKGPIQFRHGERLRLILRNDTMMEHPIHLHRMWLELVNGQGKYLPRKHTINVKPTERISVRITADHCGCARELGLPLPSPLSSRDENVPCCHSCLKIGREIQELKTRQLNTRAA